MNKMFNKAMLLIIALFATSASLQASVINVPAAKPPSSNCNASFGIGHFLNFS